MSIFGNLMSKIFGRGEAVAAPSVSPVSTAAPVATAVVDVEAVLEGLAAKSKQKLNWRTSIVDLMKLVGMDSSLGERKALAQELGYTGNMQDTASMNIWLHSRCSRSWRRTAGRSRPTCWIEGRSERPGKKLYAVRDANGRFKDIQTYERAHRADVRQKGKRER